jgi:very-short-patch-repair endonuclease
LCQDLKIVIELDGESHDHPERYKRDRLKDKYLMDNGIKVIRIKNEDVVGNLEGVSKYINALVSERAAELNK